MTATELASLIVAIASVAAVVLIGFAPQPAETSDPEKELAIAFLGVAFQSIQTCGDP